MNLIGYNELKLIHEQRIRDMQGMHGHPTAKGKPRKQQRRRFRLFRR